MFEEAKKRVVQEAKQKLSKIDDQTSILNSKLVGIKFKIERQAIKNEAREQRRNSIHKLEMEKNLNFRPKRDRSKSIPISNANMKLKVLKEIKDELMMKEFQAANEYFPGDYEIKVPTHEYSFNDINREILTQPQNLPFKPFKRKKVKIPTYSNAQGSKNQNVAGNLGEGANQMISLGIHNIQEDYDNEGSQYNGSQRNAQIPISGKKMHEIENSKEDQILEKNEDQSARNEVSNGEQAISDQPIMKQYFCKKYQTDDFIEIKDENVSEIKNLNDKINQKLADKSAGGNQEAIEAIRPSINEKREDIKNRIQQKEKFFQFLGEAGINVNQLRLNRSNSVGGESALDY